MRRVKKIRPATLPAALPDPPDPAQSLLTSRDNTSPAGTGAGNQETITGTRRDAYTVRIVHTMKPFPALLLIFLIIACMVSSGCIETGTKNTQAGTSLAGYELTEHTYLWGLEGPFSKTYDIRIWLLSTDVYKASGISGSDVKLSILKYLGSAIIPSAHIPF